MMILTLDDMIFARMRDSADLAPLLARFDNRPAVFYQHAPERSNGAWGVSQYPRVDFVVDIRDEPLHNSAGTLEISVWSATKSEYSPEQIERVIRELLHATFAKPIDGSLYCIAWARSGAFDGTMDDEKEGAVIGCMMQFSVKALPVQKIFSPDPITAISAWLKAKRPGYTVIGADDIAGWLVPSSEAPVVYWNLTDVVVERETNCCVWYRCALVGHVLAPTATQRFSISCTVLDDLAMESRVLMSDGSPMMISDGTASAEADSLDDGQLTMTVRFGVLRSVRQPYSATKVQNLTFDAP
ncbi:MAG: hypothetical protein RR482_00915 [Clostridia bacterium]